MSKPKDKVGRTREQIRGMLAAGMTPRSIAARLDISPQQVYVHMEAIRKDHEEAAS